MIYVDASVVLAELLVEDRQPPASLWTETLVCSRLLEYEAWTRVNARGLAGSHGDALHGLLARIAFVELSPVVLARALEPFPVPLRTLDALHLSSISYLREHRDRAALATYDARFARAAQALRLPLYDLDAG